MRLRHVIGQRRYRTKLSARCGWPELTALVDIFFIALLFFVLSSSFVRVSGISVELPRVKAPNIADMERFIITVTPEAEERNQIYFRDKPVSLETLRQRLAELCQRPGSNPSVVIRADRKVPFARVAEIMAVAESAGIGCFLAVMPPEDKTPQSFGQ